MSCAVFRLGRASGPSEAPVGPIEQQLRRQVTEAFVEPKPTETQQQTNGCIPAPGDVTNDYKHYSSYAAPPPAPPSTNKGPRVRARSAPGIQSSNLFLVAHDISAAGTC